MIYIHCVPTFITTSHSRDESAAVLTLHCESSGDENPVCYFSRNSTLAEQKYYVTEKEFLAILWRVKRLYQFRSIISIWEGSPIPLTATGPLIVIRWSTRMLHYNLHVKYIPGKKNSVADVLSNYLHLHFFSKGRWRERCNFSCVSFFLSGDTAFFIHLEDLLRLGCYVYRIKSIFH